MAKRGHYNFIQGDVSPPACNMRPTSCSSLAAWQAQSRLLINCHQPPTQSALPARSPAY